MEVITAKGPIPASSLGLTNSHIHLVAMPPAWLYKTPTFSNDPDYALTDVDKAVQELKYFLKAGGKTAVDATCRDYGRNPKAIKYIVEKVPEVNLILVTGFNRGIYLDDWYYQTSIDKLAEYFSSEVEEDIEGTGLKAGLIKIGADYMRILPIEEKCIKAAAIAHLNTGAPVLAHTTLGTMAIEILSLLEREGVDPASVIFYHVDRNMDPWYWEEVLQRGAYITLDQIGKIKYGPESKRIEFLIEMVKRGYEDQLLVGTDFARRSDFKSYGGGPGLGYLFDKFIPLAKKVFKAYEIEDRIVEKFVLDNPSRAFSIKK